MTIRAVALPLVVGLVACGDEEVQPPVAVEDVATVAEDTPIAIDVLANDTDPQGLPLQLLRASATGYQVMVDGPVVRVEPKPDFNGTVDIVYAVSNGEALDYGRATITVTPVNDAPVALSQSFVIGRNAATPIGLSGADIDGDALTYEIESSPAHGTLSGTAPGITYTPATSYAGADTFVYRVRDGALSSPPATVNITVVNGVAPVARPQSIAATEDTSKAITLTGVDGDNDPITYSIVEQPSHGTLTGTPPNVSYTPAANYHGADSFRFEVSDGVLTSAPATVTVQVSAVNDAPVATTQTVAATEDQAVVITLAGTDVEGDALTYTIVDGPTRGSLSLTTGATRTYTSAANWHGTDSFTFTVSDGKVTSAPATVSIAVAPAQDPPRATAQSVSVAEDSSGAIVLAGTDIDGDALTYAVATSPAHGTLSGTPPNLTYTPAANYHGSDSFTFTASDGAATSAPVAVSITVSAVNDVPVISGAALSGDEGTDIAIPLPTKDIDGDTLTYSVVTSPAAGHVSLIGTPRYNSVDYHGNVSFSLAASDGKSASAPAIFTVAVAALADPPVARDDVGVHTVGEPLRLSVLANDDDVDGDPLSIDAVTTPLHGTVQIDGDDLVYTTNAGNTADDTFTYTVSDPAGLTATATVTVGIGQFPRGQPVRYVGATGEPGDSTNKTTHHDVSSDGRYIVFASRIAFSSDDTNGTTDIFVHDRVGRKTQRVSVPTGGGWANGASDRPSISGDGRYIAFSSAATNLVPGDTNGTRDIFVRDRVAGTTTRVSVTSTGAQVSGISREPEISADGTVVAFLSSAFDLVPNDTNGSVDAFVRELATGITTRVSVHTDGGAADLPTSSVTLSGDGKVVAFVSAATNLVTGDTNGMADVFVHDRTTGVTDRASVGSTGGQANGASRGPALSHDGRFVAFSSVATNIVPGTTSESAYVRDRQGQSTFSLGLALLGLSLSGDGRYVVGHTSGYRAYVRDRFAGSGKYFTNPSTAAAWFPMLSQNGSYIVLLSDVDLDGLSHTPGTNVFVYPNPL